ncbi:hypothetical protein [Roseomonas chloroacetimidivorans]
MAVAYSSLSGLFTACRLRQDGHEGRVFERSASGLVAQREVFDNLRAMDA